MMNDSSDDELFDAKSVKDGKNLKHFIDKVFSSQNTKQKYSIFGSRNILTNSKYSDNQQEFKVYSIRWLILAIICVANISNANSWTSLSSIANYAAKYYHVSYDSINFISSLYLFISIAPFLIVLFLIDTYGIRFSIYFGVILNFIGSLLKFFTTSVLTQSTKFPILIVGQISCSLASPFIAFISTKFANSWFPKNQRVIANTLAIMSNSFGVLFGAFVSAIIVNNDKTYGLQMNYLNILNLGLSFVPLVLMFFIRSSNPPTPPSHSALPNLENESLLNDGITIQKTIGIKENLKNYFINFKNVFKSKQFLLLSISFGLGTGLLSALLTLIEQVLCVRGYSDNDAGLLSGILVLSGIFGSLCCGPILDRTKKFEELAKICICLSSIWNTLFIILQMYNNDQGILKILLYISAALLGFCSIPLIPISCELSVECTYPIPEATSSGFLLTLGNAIAVLMVFIYPQFGKKINQQSMTFQTIQTCIQNSTSNEANLQVLDYNYPLYGQSFALFALSILFVLFFKCPYLRLNNEQQKIVQQILNY